MAANNTVPCAVIFDLDGVITFTARVHAAAWKDLFDEYLQKRTKELGEPFLPFDADSDYRRYVDGKPRIDGILRFLNSRNIRIPQGKPSDPPSSATVWGLGTRKNELFKQKLEQMGVDVDHEAVRFVRELRAHKVRTGLASSSKNASLILEKTKLGTLFDAVVDGLLGERLRLRGKPEPDIFLQCLASMDPGAQPREAAIVEDAIAGIEAGRRGGFGFVLGIDRQNTGELKVHGANWVIASFKELTVDQFITIAAALRRAA
jgi:beta-phosphoglucomutase family hydrolase